MKYLGLDFDGTVVKHEFPKVGDDIGSIPWLRKLQNADVKIILNTMRSGNYLIDAINYLHSRGVKLYGANSNPDQSTWTTSPKVYAHVYIDDAALGAPLKHENSIRPYIDWDIAGPQLLERFGVSDE